MMRTMSGGPCPYYDCPNRNSFGYCKTTACVNKHCQQEQWDLPLTVNKSESVVIKPQTNADRIRAMSDEELAEWMNDGWLDVAISKSMVRTEQWLDWLRKEANEKEM